MAHHWTCWALPIAVVAALLLALSAETSALKLPSYITPCKKDDPKLNECVVKAGRAAIPHFINGDRKYRIPNLNPLTVYDFRVSQGTKSVGLAIHLKEATVHGLPNMVFDAARVDLKKRHIEWDMSGPSLEILGVYNVSGQVLILPIVGYGNANITLKNCIFNYTFDFDVQKKANGKEYMVLLPGKLLFDTSRVYIKLENLFNGDKLLGDNMNHFLNENWRDVTREVGPTIADAIGEVFREILSQISELVPWEYVYP